MNKIIEQLNNNLKQLYRQAIDADLKLDTLQKQGQGKFSALFNDDEGFEVSAKRFKPYVLEVAAEVEALHHLTDITETELKPILTKLQLLHRLLESFK